MANLILKRSGVNSNEASGAFISHTGRDASFRTITKGFAENNIDFIGDSQIAPGVDFHATLRRMLQEASMGIVLVSEDIFASPWCLYEIGILEGMNKDIVLFCDPERSALRAEIPEFLRRYPIIDDLDTLKELARRSSVFGDLFKHETRELTAAKFEEALRGKQESLQLAIELPGLSAVDVNSVRFGFIVIRLARAGEFRTNTSKCAVIHEARRDNLCTMNEDRAVDCVMITEVRSQDALETVALNSILYASQIAGDRVTYTVPLHNRYGVTFKCFIDVIDKADKRSLEAILRKAGMEDVSYSESGESQRIYFLLPQEPSEGLFHIWSPEGIPNNFLCPGSSLCD
jgi:hypothetical protein